MNPYAMPLTFRLRELRDPRGIHALDDRSLAARRSSCSQTTQGRFTMTKRTTTSFLLPIEKDIHNEQATLSNNTGALSGCRHARI
jgi:hypothetical protein